MDRLTTAVQGNERARRQPTHNDSNDVYRTRFIVEPGSHFDEIFTCEIADGVKHMRSGIEHEAAARNRRNLSPETVCLRSPILPDGCCNTLNGTNFAGTEQRGRSTNSR